MTQGSSQYKVLSLGSSHEGEVFLVPRDDWPNHGSLEVPVAFGRPQEKGGSGLNGCLAAGAGVVFDMCQDLNCSKKSKGRKYVDLTLFLFYAEDGNRTHQRSLCGSALPGPSDLNKHSSDQEEAWRSNRLAIAGLRR